jgi:hypothetical protein
VVVGAAAASERHSVIRQRSLMDNDLRKRDPRNARGPFYAVEKLCLSCGLPEDEAPDLLAKLDETER